MDRSSSRQILMYLEHMVRVKDREKKGRMSLVPQDAAKSRDFDKQSSLWHTKVDDHESRMDEIQLVEISK